MAKVNEDKDKNNQTGMCMKRKDKIEHPILKMLLVEIKCHAKNCKEYDREMDLRCWGCSDASMGVASITCKSDRT